MAKTDFHFSKFLYPSTLFLSILALLLLRGSCCLAEAQSLPPGSATFDFQYRLSETNPEIGLTTSRHESNYRLSLNQESINWGNFFGFINWVDEPFYHRRGSWLLEFRDFYFDQTRLDAALGDSLFRLSLIGDPPFRFSNLVDPDVAVEGARARLSSDRGELEVLAGDLVALRGTFGTGVEYLGETLMGMRSRFRLLPGLRLGAQILRSGRSEEQDQITYPLFRRNDLYTLSFELEPWTGYRLLQGELSLSRYRKQEEDGDRERGWDYSLILGPSIRIRQLTFDANFRHIGPNYRPFSRFYASDQEGLFFSGEYRPWDYLSLFASADRSRNNLKDDPNLSTIDTHNAILGSRLGAPPFPLLSIRYGITERKSRHHPPSETDNRLQSYTAEISYAHWGWFPLFRYQRFDYEDRVSESSEYDSDLYFLELRKTFASGSYAWANGDWNRDSRRFSDTITDTYTLRLGADYRPFSALGVRGEVSYSRARDNLDLTDTERRGILLALNAYLPWNFNLYTEYGYARTNDKIGMNDRDEHRLYLRAWQRLSWGKPVVTKVPVVPGAPPPGYGSILGVAFDDRNGNGMRDEGETPLAGIRVQLEDGTVATSDEKGKFSFTNIQMGEHTVSLDTKKVPIDYDFLGEPKRKLEVKRRGISTVEFAFLILGKMTGRVIEDANGNGKADEGEKGIANALVVASLEDKKLFTYTDEEGNFLLENLRGGTYRLALDMASLPERAEITSQELLAASLPIGGELTGLNFLVHIRPRPVIKKIFGEPELLPPGEEEKALPKQQQ